ncbi:MAG TPA: TonB-dependent receptor [Nevskia sp.]|nr:TonB-dependent receptor [Nevskia sp.]
MQQARRSAQAVKQSFRLLAIFIAALSGPVAAQSIDYAAFQKLFGEPVTTSVTGSPQRASEVPAAMEIITADEIRRSGAYDIPGVLRHVAGIDVLQWNNDNADVGVRGYNQAYSPRLLVLIDGRQVYADFYGFTPWSALPVELGAIRQIEVVKGPNSALFGFNAVDGVVNIVTQDPLYNDADQLTLRGGTQDLAEGSAVGTLRLGQDAAVRLSAGRRSDHDFGTAIPAAVFQAPRQHDNRAAFDLDGAVRFNAGTRLNFEASHSDAAQNEMGPVYQMLYTRYHTNSVMAQLESDTGYGLMQATGYTNWITANDTPGLGGGDFNFHNRVTVLRLQDVFKLGNAHTLRLSAEYRYNTESTASLKGADVFYSVASGGGMWEWRLAPSWTLSNAVRVDHLALGRSGYTPPDYPFGNADWNQTHDSLSFNSGLVWHAGTLDTLRLTVNRGVQVPNLVVDGALLVDSAPFNVTGVPTVGPTVVMNYELGWDRLVPALGGQVRASLFRQQTDNMVSLEGGFAPAGNGVVYTTAEGLGDSHATGLELEVKGALPRDWRWGLSYRLERIDDRFSQTAHDGGNILDFADTAAVNVFKGQLGWSRGSWEADAFAQYQSHSHGLAAAPSLSGAVVEPIAPYLSLDGRIGYQPRPWLTLALSGQNLLQTTQRQTSGPSVERRVLGSLTFKWGGRPQ